MEKNNNLMSGKGEKGRWITINGSHIFVEDGQSVEDAMKKQFSKEDDGKKWFETGLHDSPKEPTKARQLSASDKEIVDDAIYWAKKDGTGVKGAMEELETNMKGFLSYGENGNFKAVQDYMREQLWEDGNKETSADADTGIKQIDQNKQREDKFTQGNPDNINKASTHDSVQKDLQNYKGSGSADLVLPGGGYVQIRPQKDGTYLARTNGGQQYFASVDEAKQFVSGQFSKSLTKETAPEPKAERKKQVLWNGNMKPEDISPEYIRSLSDADCLRLLKWLNS